MPVCVSAQDWVRIGSNLGNAKIRIAAADFKPVGADPQTPSLKADFDSTLYNDLSSAGIFEVVSKSFAPAGTPGSPQEMNLSQWSAPPASAAMVAFGALSVANGRLVVYGWLDDTSNTANPQVLGKQYNEAASQDMARTIAHRFADEIIARLGGGINGIAETKIYFISSRTGSKEVWVMDYDGANQHAITHLGSISLSPRISPDNSRVAFASLGREGWSIRMYSLDLGRLVSFPAGTVGGVKSIPGLVCRRIEDRLLFVAHRRPRDLGRRRQRRKSPHGLPISRDRMSRRRGIPHTMRRLAWVSGRTGLPQIYTMDQDGANIQRMTDGGYAVSPSWSSSGQFLTFSWNRKYGPGAPGGQDIYIMDIATQALAAADP